VEVEHVEGGNIVAFHSDVLEGFDDLLFDVEGGETEVLEDVGEVLLFSVEDLLVVGHVGFLLELTDLLHAEVG
jgi:hypothetical protein